MYTDLRVDETTGQGFPLSLLDPPGFVELKTYCNSSDLTQEDLEKLHAHHASNMAAKKHPDGVKKRTNRVSLISFQQHFDHMSFENVSLLFIPRVFLEEFEGVRPPEHDTDVDFARFTIACNEFARKNDFELLLSFFACLLPSYQIDPVTVIERDALKMMMEAVHTTINPDLQILLDELPSGACTLAELIRFAFYFPPLFYPVIEFGRSFRRKLMGSKWEGFWVARIHDYSDDDARAKFSLSLRQCNVFGNVNTIKEAWHIAAHHLLLKVYDDAAHKGRHASKKKKKTSESKDSSHHHHHHHHYHQHKKHHGQHKKHHRHRDMFTRLEDRVYPRCLQEEFSTLDVRGVLRDKYGLRVGTWIFSLLGEPQGGNDAKAPELATGTSKANAGVDKVLMSIRHLSLPWTYSTAGPDWDWVQDQYEKVLDPSTGTFFWKNHISGSTSWHDPRDGLDTDRRRARISNGSGWYQVETGSVPIEAEEPETVDETDDAGDDDVAGDGAGDITGDDAVESSTPRLASHGTDPPETDTVAEGSPISTPDAPGSVSRPEVVYDPEYIAVYRKHIYREPIPEAAPEAQPDEAELGAESEAASAAESPGVDPPATEKLAQPPPPEAEGTGIEPLGH